MKAPEVTLEKILGGLEKVLNQLDSCSQVTDKFIATKEAQIAELQRRKDVATKVAERSKQVTANLKQLLALD
jgi:hypothetical protein